MSTLAQLAALVGFLLPLAIAVVQQSHWSRTVRTIVGVIISLGTAVLTAWLKAGTITLHTWGTAAIFILGAALTTYRNVWVPIGAAPWIETTILPGRSATIHKGVHRSHRANP